MADYWRCRIRSRRGGRGQFSCSRQRPANDGAVRTSLLPAPSSPLAAFRIRFRCGSIDDPEGKEGLNALTAMTIGQGGTRELTFRELTDRLYPMAATIQVQFDREVTTFAGEVHRDHLKAYYEILTGVLLRPRFDESDFRRSRDVLVAGIETGLRGNDDEGLGKAALGHLMYEGHPYRQPDAGTVQGLKSIALDDVKAHYLKCYTQGNVVLDAVILKDGNRMDVHLYVAAPIGSAIAPDGCRYWFTLPVTAR